MQRLLLLRHAKSSWEDGSLEDHDRPLSPRGERAAAVMATYCGQTEVSVDRVVCSTALRTRQTLERVLPMLRALPEVCFEPGVYEASTDRLLEHVRRHGQGVQALMLIGHNPGLEQLARLLCSPKHGAGAPRRFVTGALMEIALPSLRQASTGSGRSARFVSPKQLV